MSEVKVIPIPVDIIKNLIDMLRRTWIPKIERGTIYISLAGWKQVNFAEAFKQVPTVGALLLAKPGWYVDSLFEPPILDFSSLKAAIEDAVKGIDEIPKLELDIPSLPHPELEVKLADAFQDVANRKIGDWGVFNFARDELTSIFRPLGAEAGRIIEKDLWQDTIKQHVDKFSNEIEDEVNPILKTIRSRVNAAISKIKNGLLRATDKAIESIEKVTTQITTNTSEALNRSIDKFWAMTGQEEGIIPSFAAVDNVTQTGFKVLAPSICTIHWWSFGEFIIPGEPIANRITTIIQEYTP